jgi:hypothetical protein
MLRIISRDCVPSAPFYPANDSIKDACYTKDNLWMETNQFVNLHHLTFIKKHIQRKVTWNMWEKSRPLLDLNQMDSPAVDM